MITSRGKDIYINESERDAILIGFQQVDSWKKQYESAKFEDDKRGKYTFSAKDKEKYVEEWFAELYRAIDSLKEKIGDNQLEVFK